MNKKLLSLLAVLGMSTIGSISYLIARPNQGVTRLDLADAGVNASCETVTIAARVQDLCQNSLADGGLSRRYRTIRDVAYHCPAPRPGEPEVLIPRWTTRPALRGCFNLVGQEAIRVLGADSDDGGTGVEAALDECACRARGKVCRIADGGTMDFARTYVALAGPFVGAGCEPTSCAEMDGEQGQGLADECR